jgi:flagellar biosynthesis protein FlhF
VAHRLVAAVQSELSTAALGDRRTVVECLRRHVMRLIPTPPLVTLPPGRPSVVFLVGPTGVGKTTTIAKLAARFALMERYRVALITVDTFRVAAAEQLRIILIDTPGRSQRNTSHLGELHAFIRAVPQSLIYLTIDACTCYEDMLDAIKRFSPDQLDGLIITKIDETRRYGMLVNLADQTGRPLTYLTTGQEVPDDIEEVTARRVSDLVLGGVA